jgi:hypothetical protein
VAVPNATGVAVMELILTIEELLEVNAQVPPVIEATCDVMSTL